MRLACSGFGIILRVIGFHAAVQLRAWTAGVVAGDVEL
jgi:hypothetical protein